MRGPVPCLVDGNSPSFTDRWFNQERGTFVPVKRFSDVYYCHDECYGSVAINAVNGNHVNFFFSYLGKFRVQTTSWGYKTFSVLPKPAAVCFVTGQPLRDYSSCLGLCSH
ncbi:hypothetical protein U1Q18_041071 [Sarracenia purpurea var. burkii]